MKVIGEKYINPFTDYGFKRIFGAERNKNILIDFFNEVLTGFEEKINEITYLKNNPFGNFEANQKDLLHFYCISENGKKFIVELQKMIQKSFEFRNLHYSTFPIFPKDISELGINLEFDKIYSIVIGNVKNENNDENKFRYDLKFVEKETKEIFYDKIHFIYLEMPKFNKTIDELKTGFEKWLFVIKNLNHLERVPEKLQEKKFLQLFETAEIADFSPEEYQNYEDSLKHYSF